MTGRHLDLLTAGSHATREGFVQHYDTSQASTHLSLVDAATGRWR